MRNSQNAECGARTEKETGTGSAHFLLKRVFIGSLFPVFLVLLFRPGAVCAELIDRVVASVNNEVITLAELNQAIGFNAALGGANRDGLREQTLDGLINRRLLIQEAHRLKFVEISGQDTDVEIEKVRKRLGSEKALSEFLAKLDMTREQLRWMLGERLLVERFVEKKIGLFIRVGRDEAQDYFNRNPAAFKGKQFSDVQKEITSGLQARKLEQQMSRYLAELRNKADIRVNP